MKKGILFLALMGFLSSCCKEDDDMKSNCSDIVGSWKLTEVLADPGDGSGTFHSVTSSKTLKFNKSGNVTSNGSICEMSIESNSNSSATYSEDNETINCQNTEIRYELNGNTLVLTYPCFEACEAKYIKVQ